MTANQRLVKLPSGQSVYTLGVGTVWCGKPWPPSKAKEYVVPTEEEIRNHLTSAVENIAAKGGKSDAMVMVDTATEYGNAEDAIAKIFQQCPGLRSRIVLATKFGGSTERAKRGEGYDGFDLSRDQMIKDFEQSIQRLGSVDILYSHVTNQVPFDAAMDYFRDQNIIKTLTQWKNERKGGLTMIGASISNGKVLEAVVKENLLSHINLLQVPGWLVLQNARLINDLKQRCALVIVANSPVRFTLDKNEPPETCYRALWDCPHIDVVLTGTRNHMSDTIEMYQKFTSE